MDGLGLLDLAVIAAYLGGLLALARALRPRGGSADYFLASRSIPWWAAACSFLATAVSAATVVAIPAKGYATDLRVVGLTLAGLVSVTIISLWFLPAWYRLGVQTVYGLLGHRFGSRAVVAAGWAFLAARGLASGARLYIAAMAIAFLISPAVGQAPAAIAVAVAALAGFGTLLALGGGIRVVIWTDVVQALVLVGTALVAVGFLISGLEWNPDTWQRLLETEDGHSRLALYDGWFGSWGNNYSFLAVLVGWSVFYLGPYGTDQDLAQRYLTT